MNKGNLVIIEHRDLRINGKFGVIIAVNSGSIFGIVYSVRIPSFDSEVTLLEGQCRLIA